MRVKAGALQYVVLLSLLIFFLMGMYLLQAHYSNLQVDEVLVEERLRDNLASSRVLLKADPMLSLNEGEQQLDLFQTPQSLVELRVQNWGVYKVVTHRSVWRHHFQEETFLLGDNIWGEERPSLFLADRNRYLSVCGETWLGGPVDLPVLGIRKSYVDGVGYYRDKAVQGAIRRSKPQLPALRSDLTSIFETQFKVDFERDSVMPWEAGLVDSLKASFKRRPLCLWSPEVLNLEHIALKGHIKVISQQAIRVGRNVQLDQCILVAPEVSFSEGFEGRVQVFARDSVGVGKNSHFLLPSVIFMNGSNGSKKLILEEDVRFAGEIVLAGKEQQKMPLLKVAKGCRLEGLVYCDGTVELEGDVAGSLYTNRFLLRTPSALYENHLLNNRLDVSDLKSSYVGVSWFDEPKKKQILEWLY